MALSALAILKALLLVLQVVGKLFKAISLLLLVARVARAVYSGEPASDGRSRPARRSSVSGHRGPGSPSLWTGWPEGPDLG